MSIGERDYMRRNDKPPQIRWEYALMVVVGAILLIAFSVQHCSRTTDRHLSKGSLVVNVNEATAKELQTLLGVGAARAELIIQNRPYQSVDELFEKRALPKTVVDANRSRLKTTGKNERTARRD
ncbi:MAG TPA: helix-hairpin-helix domain-containing protein [Candidatus Baltobacteraceae bacterium]|nr:helix-hairpin-helix domain-containing protein [Candidatus Baltobacteraceae bacterium]